MTTSSHPDQSPAVSSQEPFSLEVEKRGQAVLVRLIGACTMDVADAVGEKLVALASNPNPLIVVDLARLRFIESTGLGGIVSGHLRARKHNGELRIVAPPPPIRHLLELTRLTNLFQVFGSVEDAMPNK